MTIPTKQEYLTLCDNLERAADCMCVEDIKKVTNLVRSLLSASPEGYVSVPVEPTEAMICAYLNVPSFNYAEDTVRARYKAVLAAAPPPAQAGGVQDWPKHFRDLDPQARAASDKLDRAGYYDEATLIIQLLNLAKNAVLEVARIPSPQPIEAHSKSQFKRLTAMGVEVVEAGRAASDLASLIKCVKLRIAYVGMPQEPRDDEGKPRWDKTIEVLDHIEQQLAALQSPPSPAVGKLVEALRMWVHWYDTDSSEFNRDTAYHETVKLLAPLPPPPTQEKPR